jgi:glucosamine--fructose-6-phosphate aminotransferase (isomerizing)
VHNGIIENHDELRAALKAKGYRFTSQTDTEVIATWSTASTKATCSRR